MRLFRELGWFFWQERRAYGLGALFLIVIALINLLPPYWVGRMVDAIRSGTVTPAELARTSLAILAVAGVSYALRYGWRLFLFGSAYKLGMLLRNRLFARFVRLMPAFYQREQVGDLLAHVTNDVEALEAAAGEGVMTLVDAVSMGGLVVAMLFWLDGRLALVALLPMPAIAVLTKRLGDAMHERFERAQGAFSALSAKVQEGIGGIRVLRALGQTDREVEAFRRAAEAAARENVEVAKIDALYYPVIFFFVGLSYFLTVAVGALFIVQGTLTLGTLTSFTMYLGHLIWPMLAFGYLFNIMERGSASYDRIRRLLTAEPAAPDRPGADPRPPRGPIAIRIRRFAYPKAAVPALEAVFVDLPEGATLGVVGPVGAGKSTLLRLLVREYDVEDGEIAIGGRPLSAFTLSALRTTVVYVPQEPVLFSATVRENLAFARPEAPFEAIVRAAKLAELHDDIVRFPEGYETPIGERGVTLSGGQRQRLALARALLLDPEVLVIDDGLSAVDGRTEARILANLRAERRGRTTIIAAHRLSAVEAADRIIVLIDGRVAEQGDHASLMAAGGWYARTYRRQKQWAAMREALKQAEGPSVGRREA
ncbi:MAG: ATP-binding cassette domain-containing protein [Hydrogenibacillus schlegelii]|nr:ATP-binding cassette domain-containing protein [Hydrogenibacillus schlegelii]